MKKRNFLVPLAVSVAALVGATDASANINDKSSMTVESKMSAPVLSSSLTVDDFIIQRSDVLTIQTAGHRSHVSHASHASHASHRSSGW